MFDALRRAESERRRKHETSEAVQQPALEPVAPIMPAGPAAPGNMPPAHSAPRGEPAAVPARQRGASAFEADMLREVGILRNSVESKLEKRSGRVIVFTSAMHEEGVTTLAIAYARLIAMHEHQRVLMIELNARTPSVARRLGLAGTEGVTHYFGAQRPLRSLVQRPAGEDFDVLHVGVPDATQIQINLERAFPHLVKEALQSYDTIVVDAPPVVMCPETPPLGPHVDGVVLVVQSGRTKRETVDRSIKQIQQFQGRVLGVVLNRKRYYIPYFIYRRL